MSNHLDMSWRQKIGIYGILISNVITYLSSRDQFNKKYNMGQASLGLGLEHGWHVVT